MPFSFAELSARVRALIRLGAAVRPTELHVTDLRLHPATRRAWWGTTESESRKEFALLELFLRHPGRVLTRTPVHDYVLTSAARSTARSAWNSWRPFAAPSIGSGTGTPAPS